MSTSEAEAREVVLSCIESVVSTKETMRAEGEATVEEVASEAATVMSPIGSSEEASEATEGLSEEETETTSEAPKEEATAVVECHETTLLLVIAEAVTEEDSKEAMSILPEGTEAEVVTETCHRQIGTLKSPKEVVAVEANLEAGVATEVLQEEAQVY